MSNSSIQASPSLVGTKWLVSETKGQFSPFYITFNAGGKAPVATVNGFFTGTFTWSGDYNGVDFGGSYDNEQGTVYSCMGSPADKDGHYKITWSGGVQHGKFTMVQQ